MIALWASCASRPHRAGTLVPATTGVAHAPPLHLISRTCSCQPDPARPLCMQGHISFLDTSSHELQAALCDPVPHGPAADWLAALEAQQGMPCSRTHAHEVHACHRRMPWKQQRQLLLLQPGPCTSGHRRNSLHHSVNVCTSVKAVQQLVPSDIA